MTRRKAEKKGSPWAKELYNVFAPTRHSLRDIPEQDINNAIDEALHAVRRKGKRTSGSQESNAHR